MKQQSVTNRYGQRIAIGQSVAFRPVNSNRSFTGTVKTIDTNSDYAKAYGAQVSFTDCPYTVTADDCTVL